MLLNYQCREKRIVVATIYVLLDDNIVNTDGTKTKAKCIHIIQYSTEDKENDSAEAQNNLRDIKNPNTICDADEVQLTS